MERTLVQQGQSTLMVSLPRSWIVEQGLTRGSEVSLSMESGAVVVKAKGSSRVREITLQIKGNDDSLIRTLVTNAYRTGIDKVHCLFENESQYRILQHTVKTKLLGFQVTHKEKGRCMVENVTEPDPSQFENILSKFFMSSRLLLEQVAIRASGRQSEEDIDELEDRIMQYENFCLRALSRGARSSAVDFLQIFIHTINHGQRECYHALKYIKTRSAQDLKYLDGCTKLLDLLVAAYAQKSVDTLHQVHELEEQLKVALPTTIARSTHYLASGLRLFYLANSPLAGWLMLQNRSVKDISS